MRWSEATTPHELRRMMRVRSKGSIQIWRGKRSIRGRVVDLAVGGVSMRADGATGLGRLAGKHVSVELRLDASSTMLFALQGRVVRASAANRMLAIELCDVTRAFDDCVRHELLAGLEYDAMPHVVIVDVASPRRHSIARAFRDGGCEVSEVSTPWEAIARLGRGQFEPGIIAIADTVPESVAEELREFLRDEHPHAHMVAIGPSARDRDPASSWISGRDPAGDVAIRVGRVITAHAGLCRRRCGSDPTQRSRER
jgi:CheY-like chemotaxis protein